MNFFVLLNTKKDILKNEGNRAVLGHHWLSLYLFFLLRKSMMPQNSLVTNFLQNNLPCSAEQRHSYRFWTTWGWVNDDSIFFFGWTILLITHHYILILTELDPGLFWMNICCCCSNEMCVRIWLTDKLHAWWFYGSVLFYILWIFQQFDLYFQLNIIHLKLKTVRGDSGYSSKSFILGWNVVYLSAQRLSFCPYAL